MERWFIHRPSGIRTGRHAMSHEARCFLSGKTANAAALHERTQDERKQRNAPSTDVAQPELLKGPSSFQSVKPTFEAKLCDMTSQSLKLPNSAEPQVLHSEPQPIMAPREKSHYHDRIALVACPAFSRLAASAHLAGSKFA